MAGSNIENSIIIFILSVLIVAYVYVLLSPSQPKLSVAPRSFVISRNFQSDFESFVKSYRDSQNWTSYSKESLWGGSYWNDTFSEGYGDQEYKEWGSTGLHDDFFMEESNRGRDKAGGDKHDIDVPNEPSDKFRCQEGWVSIRSELNYKFLWVHGNSDLWLSATATMDTPLHRKSFEVVPVHQSCDDGGWVRLREGDSLGFLYMVAPTGQFAVDEWVVKIGSDNLTITANDTRYHFLLEDAGYILNKGAMAFLNVMAQAEYGIRGHTGGWDRTKASGREYGAAMHFMFVNTSDVTNAITKEQDEMKQAEKQDEEMLAVIQSFPLPPSSEKRVISFGLYGSKDKYIIGAVKNAELAKKYFPGWICRYYVTSDVPETVLSQLKALGSEIESVPPGMGYISGMFWRFMVGEDPTVQRYIIRDVDSRLNARDRIAVEDWITSKYDIHIMRDHVNHCIPMNGGTWGGVKGAIPNLRDKILAWKNKDEYMSDQNFLEEQIWPEIKSRQMSHDSYCCDRFPNSRPFITRRPPTYQHVGQVFDAEDHPRFMDIDGYIRGVPIPSKCRQQADWIYG